MQRHHQTTKAFAREADTLMDSYLDCNFDLLRAPSPYALLAGVAPAYMPDQAPLLEKSAPLSQQDKQYLHTEVQPEIARALIEHRPQIITLGTQIGRCLAAAHEAKILRRQNSALRIGPGRIAVGNQIIPFVPTSSR